MWAEAHGLSLHAAVRTGAHQRKEPERLCCYISRPAIAKDRCLNRAMTATDRLRLLVNDRNAES